MSLNFLLKRTATASKRPTAASVSLGELNIDYDTNTFGLFAKNSAGTITKIGPVEVGTTAPNATPAGSAGNSRGEMWLDTTNNLLKTYNGTAFVNPVPNGSTTVVGILQLTDSTSSTSTTTAATPNSVKTAYDLANAAVPKSTVTAKGDLIAATASATVTALPIGTNGQFLSANSACTTGMQWCTLSLACVPCSAFVAKGDILGGTGSATFSALTVGSNNQILVADSACTTGLKWLTSQGALLCGYTCGATPFNTAIGCLAGTSIAGALCVTSLGYNAGNALTTGGCNVAVGTGALSTSLLTSQVVAVGVGAASGVLTAAAAGTVAVGFNALLANTTAAQNTAVGFCAGSATTTGGNNTFVGYCSGKAQTSTNNTAVGANALANAGVNNNTAVGYCAGAALTTGGSNTFMGASAGDQATTADNSVAIGYNSLGAVHTPGGTVAIGTNALAASTSGAGNTAVGFNAGTAITTGTCNTVLGFCALTTAGIATQANNVAIGSFAGAAVTLSANTLVGFCSGATLANTSGNTFIGCGAGRLSTTGQANTVIGCGAMGTGITTGSNNFAGGVLAGDALTSGSTNTFLGYTSGRLVTTGGQNTIIGAYGGTTALANNVVLSDGAGTIRFQSNASGAISLGAGGAYGTAGQILVSGGSGAAPTWSDSGAIAANYGSFVRTTTQTNTGGASGNAVSYDTISSANNFSVVSGSRITAAVAGTYQVLASLQVQKTDAGSDDFNFWVKKNGVNEPNSAYNLTLQGSGAAQLGYINWVVTLAAGGYVELWWYSADVNVRLLTDPAVAPYPAVPASGFIIHPMGA